MRCEIPDRTASASHEPAATFTQFVVKLHSRCNFGCPDCYVYEHRDRGWVDEPRVMSPAVMSRLSARIAEHVRRHVPERIQVVLHGGEPLLAGRAAVERFAARLRADCDGLGTEVGLLVQTNASLLDQDFLDVFLRHGVTVGVSLDGTRGSHDRRRPDRAGRGTYNEVARGLSLLRLPRYRELYGGLLCVVDAEADPVQTYEALLAHEPPGVDLLLPHATWRYPPPRPRGAGHAPYGRWLAAVFDRWFDAPRRETSVRLFDSLLDLHLGGTSTSEVWGPYGADVVVIQPSGLIEYNDILKTVSADAARSVLHIAAHDFDRAAADPGFAAERAGPAGLCRQCRTCPVVQVCGGGLRAHRHHPGNGFDNPSVYCADLRFLIDHVRERIADGVTALRERLIPGTTPDRPPSPPLRETRPGE
ncbi:MULTISPECIES: FxsB family cyclophane-forming radical SAM/SPASM peptide maturase [unclassified Streptomyces]|uniref:FxsB family cyclophane-forming radical SAM/SPASM peptide maturase n=1 Tax=unclassified Streptomyces TaxID=2593676 RepID=UPI002442E2D4|nr:FxsB family cyclophane-forming radical SAM/SPASM peptide maturase [Streptomyces sp. DH41]MDG9728646.1 FxsB family radical SAM/SPASM domain protein [Streptomyces sp. DH41]